VFKDNFAHGDLHPGNILVREEETSDMKQKKLSGILPFSLISKSTTYPVSIVILDCGITASLDDRGKECLKEMFTAVVTGDVSSGLVFMFIHIMLMSM
jgi:predicted unusual protein kinase regulating ubiquinone biosynthesis (AarF/ABC1/UbiB family)